MNPPPVNRPPVNRLRVGLCQIQAFNLPEAEAALAACLAAIDEAAALGVRLIVLPECAYPAYFLESRARYDAVARPRAEVLDLFGERAARHGAWICAGLALPDEAGVLRNSALLFAPDGSVAARYDKTFLWHFDACWFEPGGRYPVVDIGPARVGMLICADGRQPEIARGLALAGADVIIDCTAWVAFGRTAAALASPQIDYLMPARALENGVWVVAADKCGTEAGSLMYAGQSGVMGPDGVWRARAAADRPQVLVQDLEIGVTAPPVARRPAFYRDLTLPTASLPAATQRLELMLPGDVVRRAAVMQIAAPISAEAFLALLRRQTHVQALQDVDVLVAPEVVAEGGPAVVDAVRAITRAVERAPAVVFSQGERRDGRQARVGYVVEQGQVRARHVATHAGTWEEAAALGDVPPPLVRLAAGQVGLLVGAEGLVPELGRSLMLRGADVLAWTLPALPLPLEPLVRARADENRVFVAAAAPRADRLGAFIIAPTGAIIASGLLDRDLTFSQAIPLAEARQKALAPRTDALLSRRPAFYGALLAE